MKKILLFFISSILFVGGFAQNLVRNGSFEKLNIDCILDHSAIYANEVQDWYTPSTSTTPDVFNSCDTLLPTPGIAHSYSSLSTPKNFIGFQKAITSYRYAGFFISGITIEPPFRTNPWHEVISQRLSQPLDSGVNYSFSMKVSVGEISELFLDGLGVCLHTDSLIVTQDPSVKYISSNLADINWKNNGALFDTLNWITLSGNFRANGDEKYIHISDMDSSKTQSDYIYIDKIHDPYWPAYAYYYIDDVALWRADDSTYISSDIGQADTTICYGDSILLGSYDYDETYYRWEKITHGGQPIKSTAVFKNKIKSKVGWAEQQDYYTYFKREQIYDSGFVWVKPTKTTSYILETTNCIFEKTYDTVVVTVQKCGPNAGMDTAVCKNSTLVLGDSYNIGYSCQWHPNTFLSSDTAAMPTMTATQSMMYYLSISNASGVIKTDSIYVIAGDCYYSVEVRDDTLICKGDTVHLGKHTYSGAQYEWTPNWLLNNNTIANPYCLADTTILYTLKLTDIVGNISYDSVLVTVTVCPGFEEIKGKSLKAKVYPNPAKEQITFELSEYSISNYEISIFNSMGAIVYNENFNSDIKKINTSKFKSGIYFYRIVDSEKRSMLGKFIVF